MLNGEGNEKGKKKNKQTNKQEKKQQQQNKVKQNNRFKAKKKSACSRRFLQLFSTTSDPFYRRNVA